MSAGPGGAAVWFKWDGLAELVDQFRTLAPDLTTTTTPEVLRAAESARAAIFSGYPSRTGNLRKGLAVTQTSEDTRTRATVVNVSPHALVYERGTQARHTALGANRGSMPPDPIFSATMVRTRRSLYAGPVPRVLTQFGLKVTGSVLNVASITLALLAILQGDAALRLLLPGGVWFAEAPPGATRFGILSLVSAADVPIFGGPAYKDTLYLVEARALSTTGTDVENAFARIKVLLTDAPLVVATDYGAMLSQFEEEIELVEVDDLDPSLRWNRCGGHLHVMVAPLVS